MTLDVEIGRSPAAKRKFGEESTQDILPEALATEDPMDALNPVVD